MTRLIFSIKIDKNNNIVFKYKDNTISELLTYQVLSNSLAKIAHDDFSLIKRKKNKCINIWLNVEEIKIIVTSTYEKWETIELVSEVVSSLALQTLEGDNEL